MGCAMVTALAWLTLSVAIPVSVARAAVDQAFLECLVSCSTHCVTLPTQRRCFSLIKRCAKQGQQVTCPSTPSTTSTTPPTTTVTATTATSSTTTTTLLVPYAYQGGWGMTLDSYDVSSTDSMCQPTETAVPFELGTNVGDASMTVYWCSPSGCAVTAYGPYQDGGVFDAVSMATNPSYDETQDYQVHFSNPTAATLTVTRLRDYHFMQCVVHWYGTMGR